MIAKDLISYYLPSASCDKTPDELLALMDEHKCTHIALVDNGEYFGVISESELYDIDDADLPLKQLRANLIRPYVNVYQFIYEVLQVLTEFNLSIVPVLDDKEDYLGCIALPELAQAFAKIANVNELGGIVVIEMNARDYSLAQVAQIVESDNAKILSSYISNIPDSLKIDLVLKINKKDLSGIISAFNRYNFTIKASFHESKFDEDMQRRYDQFMNYLNM